MRDNTVQPIPMEINQFADLLLADLAKQSQVVILGDPDHKEFYLPMNYKQIIQCILTAKNGWKDRFSILIDTDEYFQNHFLWELELTKAILQVVKGLGKEIEMALTTDCLVITYSQKEITAVLSKYSMDQIEVMDHFANLLQDDIFRRPYQERFKDHYAESVETMRQIESRDEQTTIDDILNPQVEPKKKPSFVKKLGQWFK